jgi:hypothetical protein
MTNGYQIIILFFVTKAFAVSTFFCRYKRKEVINILLFNETVMGKEEYKVCCTEDEKRGLAWFKTGI